MSLERGMSKMTAAGRWMQGAATGMAVFAVTFLVSFVSGSIFLAPKASNAETDGSSVSVNVSTTLAISTDATDGILSIPLIPTATGTEAIGVLNVDVSTNNLTGYTLSVGSSTNTTDLVHTADTTATIPTTTATTTAPAALTTNQWGYSNWTDTQIANSTAPSTYYRVPGTTSDTIRTTAEPLAHSVSRLSFAARADTTIPAGTYAHTLSFTATSNYVPAPVKCPVLAGKTYLQDVTAPTRPPFGVGGQRVVLTDRRDGQEYYVQNIVNQDGSCIAWMETNLRYAGDGDWDQSWGYDDDRYATTATLAANTANPNDNTRPLIAQSANSAYMGNSPDADTAYTVAAYADSYTLRPTGTTAQRGSTDYTNTAASGGFYGYLYNWCAAMGGQTNACTMTETSQDNIDAATSVCPAGWHVPTGNTGGEYQALNATVNGGSTTSDAGLRDAFLIAYSGGYSDSLNYQGSYGYYWSSTIFSATTSYNLTVNNGLNDIFPGTVVSSRNLGLAVRCVKGTSPSEDTTTPLPAMQDFTATQCSALAPGATIQLRDDRDDKVYRVRKMADSRCWMIDNLAYSLLQNDTGTTPNTGSPAYSPSAQVDNTPEIQPWLTSTNDVAQYAMTPAIFNIPNNGNSIPSYLYNWCAAMGDISTNCATTVGYTAGQPAAPQTGICPGPADASGFRLPIVGSTPVPSILGDGTNQAAAAATTTNEFAKLDIWLGGTGVNRYPANTFYNFFYTDNSTNPELYWLGSHTGFFDGDVIDPGWVGLWASSTAYSGTESSVLITSLSGDGVSPGSYFGKSHGTAVRCIL